MREWLGKEREGMVETSNAVCLFIYLWWGGQLDSRMDGQTDQWTDGTFRRNEKNGD